MAASEPPIYSGGRPRRLKVAGVQREAAAFISVHTNLYSQFEHAIDILLKLYMTYSTVPWSAEPSLQVDSLVEYTNKLFRQYIPKRYARGAKIIQIKLNRKPHDKLNFSTPNVELFKHFC